MHHYPFHPGDYVKDTAHLSPMEDLCYRRLLDLYYDSERPIPLETDLVSRRLRLGSDLVICVLREFFSETKDGWRNAKCDAVLADYKAKADRAKKNGRNGGRPAKPKNQGTKPTRLFLGSDKEPRANPEETGSKANHKPITKNQEPKPESTPIIPHEGDVVEELLLEVPTSKMKLRHQKKDWTPTPEQLTVNSWFGRQPTTPWSEKELAIWNKLHVDSIAEGLRVLDAPYRQKATYIRKDLKTLLNNWQGEIDRYRSASIATSDVRPSGNNDPDLWT